MVSIGLKFTKNSADSVKSVTQPNKELPRWLKLAIVIYEKLKQKQIPAYVIDVDKYDQKILRQVMNKLRGKHDFTADILEFKQLQSADKLQDFAELIAKPISEFRNKIAAFDEIMEQNTQTDNDISLDSSTQIILNFTNNKDYRLVSSNLLEFGDSKESAIVDIIKFANKHRV